LTLFEIFCERAYDAMGAMEWSWKFERRRCVANRVLWLGAPGRREATSRNLRWLAGGLSLVPTDVPGGLDGWLDLLNHHTDRAIVAYAGPDTERDRPGAIKLYLTLDLKEASAAQLLRAVMPRLPVTTPLEGATLLLCHASYDGAPTKSRVYL